MRTYVFIAALAISCTLQAQTMQNIKARNIQSLDGQWKSIIDPYGHGNWSYFNDKDFDGTKLQDYDFGTSPELRVPGDWNTQRKELYYYEGNMWYRKRFRLNAVSPQSRLFLHFDAANYKTKVWLNGKEIGEHEGGYSPFEFDITDKVKRDGENSLVVRVNNERLAGGIPTFNTDWWNYGGLTRSVCIVETQPTFIYDYCFNWNGSIEGWVQLKGDDVAAKNVTLKIPALKISKTLTTDGSGRATFSLKAKPKLWSPESPVLYEVALTLGEETIADLIGFRTISTAGDKILLNGKPVFLAGVNIHEETFGDSRRATTIEDDSLLLQAAKDLGCNFVRLAHYPHNEDMVRLADRMGLMVWSEIPLYWGIDWRNQQTYKLAVQQLREMVQRDHNRASIIIWSIANETAVNSDRTDFLTRLANEARSLDSSRLISAALQNVNKQIAHNVYTVEDPLHEALDLFSFNEYIGWYDNVKEACDSITWVLPENKPIVISEFGGGAKFQMHNGDSSFFSEDNLASLYRHQFRMLAKIKGLAGTIPWVLKDFRSPHRMLPGVQDDFNRKGLLSEKGEKKQAWQIVHDWNYEVRGNGVK
ncbi:MAG: beta galactosidase jelly roll domain-containing protein [Bacteroidaceae bacterium]|nr:beta galactosidase jelly roll domain-containing protein [Bacteroidaceae bacterium]